MDLRELESVVSVYTCGSFLEASYQTSFAVSVISKHVKRVEDELGVVLFSRRTRQCAQMLTEDGERLMPLIVKAVDSMHFLYRQAEQLKSDPLTIKISSTTSMDAGLFDDILSDFCVSTPDIKLESFFDDWDTLPRKIESGELDGAFTLYTEPEENFRDLPPEVAVLSVCRICSLLIGLSDRHPLAARKSVDLRDLADETFLFNVTQEKDPAATARVMGFTGREPGDVKKRYMDFKNFTTVLKVVANGHAVVPKLMTSELSFPGVTFIPVEGWHYCSVLKFLYNKNNRGKSFLRFKKCVEDYRDAFAKNLPPAG